MDLLDSKDKQEEEDGNKYISTHNVIREGHCADKPEEKKGDRETDDALVAVLPHGYFFRCRVVFYLLDSLFVKEQDCSSNNYRYDGN